MTRSRSLHAGARPAHLALAAGLAAALVAAAPSHAHVRYDRPTLAGWARAADAVVIAEVRQPLHVWRAPDGSERREVLDVAVRDVLLGAGLPRELEVLIHAEGEPAFARGDRAVLFLARTARHAGLARLAARFPFLSTQGAGQEWRLGSGGDLGDGELTDVVRGWLRLRACTDPAATRHLLLRELRSADERLRADAILELVAARGRAGLLAMPADVAPFAALATGEGLRVPEALALARALDGAGGFRASEAMLAQVGRAAERRDRVALLRAAASVADPRLDAWIASELDQPDALLRAEAATALGRPWRAAYAGALARASRDPEERVALAALRALSALGTPAALRALADASRDERPRVAGRAAALLRAGRRQPAAAR